MDDIDPLTRSTQSSALEGKDGVAAAGMWLSIAQRLVARYHIMKAAIDSRPIRMVDPWERISVPQQK